MKKIAFVYNSLLFASSFTLEILQEAVNRGFKVYVIGQVEKNVQIFNKIGVDTIDLNINRRGMNIFEDYKYYKELKRVIRKIKPDLIYTFTIKPNIYGNLIGKKYNIPVISRVSGLGTSFNKKISFFITKILYRFSIRHSRHVFFENSDNRNKFNSKILKLKSSSIIPGSGVNVDYYKFQQYPENTGVIKYAFIGRVMKEKGIEEFFEVAKKIKETYRENIEFHVVGSLEEDYKAIIKTLTENNIVIYHGFLNNPKEFMRQMHCIVLPSWHEGMSNTMLEAQSIGRPVIGSDVPGIKETFIDNVSGYSFKVKQTDELENAIIKFNKLSYDEKAKMGIKGRQHVEHNFDRSIVVNKYMEFINDKNLMI